MSRISAAIAALRGRPHPQSEGGGPGMALDVASAILRDAPHAMIVIQIANGYLLRVDTTDRHRLTGSAQLTYAPDAAGVATEIIAHQARAKIGVEQYELTLASMSDATRGQWTDIGAKPPPPLTPLGKTIYTGKGP